MLGLHQCQPVTNYNQKWAWYPVIRLEWVIQNLYNSGFIYHRSLPNAWVNSKLIDVFCCVKFIKSIWEHLQSYHRCNGGRFPPVFGNFSSFFILCPLDAALSFLVRIKRLVCWWFQTAWWRGDRECFIIQICCFLKTDNVSNKRASEILPFKKQILIDS